MMYMSDPQYANKDAFMEDMKMFPKDMYYVAIAYPAKVVFMENDEGQEFLTITMAKPKWQAIAQHVIHGPDQS